MAQSGFGERFPARDSAVSKALAANVRRLRKEHGWTQDDLATLLMLEAIATRAAPHSRLDGHMTDEA
jgi:ribosome-binding protein aMBF1 (putative translation factor)